VTGSRYPRGGRTKAAKALVLLASLFLFAGCGAKSISVGSIPFPAKKPVFLTGDGKTTAGLPRSSEPLRMVFLDSPWCPQCVEAWGALGSAASTFPPGSVHIYRILFDREKIYAQGGNREVAPIDPSAARGKTDFPSHAALPAVTTLTALPEPFRDQFQVGHVPLILLLDDTGTVEKRWTGYSPSMRDQLADAVRRRTGSPPPTEK
jgi:predicted small lipoprotein YifL